MVTEFRLPEVGENVESATVTRVMIEPGQRVETEQTVLELETEKATLEVPSIVAGTVREVKVKPGQTIEVGAVIMTVDEEGSAAEVETGPTVSRSEEGQPEPEPAEVREEIRKGGAPEPQEEIEREVEEEIKPAAARAEPARPAPQPAAPQPAPEREEAVPAAPAVRRLAREIGVDITQVRGTGPGGRIGEEDVKRHARERGAGPTAGQAVAGAPLPDFSRWGAVERQPLPTIRRLTGEHVLRSWTAIPHVHQFDLADVTELERLRREHNGALPAGEPKLTFTGILVKLMAGLLGRYPRFNASIDPAANELILKHYVNIGVAVNTERGLVVPVLRDANKKSIRALTAELAVLSEQARAGKLAPEQMQGGCFTISNLGGIGGTAFTPIVNAPEVAILGVARAQEAVVPYQGQPAVRLMLTLSLGYDHRVIDGAEGAEFLREAVRAISNPFELLMEV